MRDVIEALLFTTGTLAPTHQPICRFTSFLPNVVEGFPRGIILSVLISSALTAPHQQAVGKLLDDMSTLANLHTIRALSDDRAYMEGVFRLNQFSGSNEFVILDMDDGQTFCGALGCGGGRLAPGATTPQFRNAFTIAQRDAAPGIIAHELGPGSACPTCRNRSRACRPSGEM